MSLTRVLNIASAGISAQAQRLNTVASNLANADSVAGPDGRAYKARHVVFTPDPISQAPGVSTVKVAQVIEEQTAPRRFYDPKHPLADGEGFVTTSNVNPVEEMVNMISAARSYQTNVEVANTAKALLAKTLTLGT
jgi:flagellar basal-body rod protein FlgC